jgi:hypothetical protein
MPFQAIIHETQQGFRRAADTRCRHAFFELLCLTFHDYLLILFEIWRKSQPV